MAGFFKTLEELREHYPLSVNFQFSQIEPSIEAAEDQHIKPYIGADLYDDLVAKIEAGSALSAEEQALVDKVRPASANYSAFQYIPIANVLVGANGITVAKTDTDAPASEWRVRDLQRSTLTTAHRLNDKMLDFIEANAADYPLYEASAERTDAIKLFVNSSKIFNEYFQINSSRSTFLRMLPIMKRVEERLIKPTICPELFDEIKTQILDNSVTALNQKVLDIIRPAVVHLTVSKAVVELAVLIDGRGITVFENSTEVADIRMPADKDYLANIKRQAKEDGEHDLEGIKEFLNANVTDYPLYEASDCYDETYTGQVENEDDSGIYFT